MATADDAFQVDVEISLLYDPNAPLDHDVLATIASNLLNLKDTKKSQEIPLFRIRELLTIVQRVRTTLLNEVRLTESLLALYCLCLHYSVHTVYSCDVLVELVTLLQFLSLECLVVEQRNRRPNSLEMLNPLEVFQKDDRIETRFKLEIFTDNLEIARQITRETLLQSRALQKLRSLKPDERKRAMPKHIESIQPYCIYFLANLALCHIASVMHQVGNLTTCVGVIEHIMIAMLTNTQVPGSASSVNKKDTSGGVPYDYSKCFNNAQQLAKFVGHYVLDEPTLRQMQMIKVKYLKKLTNPEISFIQYRVSVLRTTLGVRSTGKSSDTGLVTNKMLFARGFHFVNDCNLSIDANNPPPDEEEEISVVTPSIKTNTVVTSVASSNQKSGRSHPSIDSAEELKRTNHYWDLKRTFRPLFLTLNSLLWPNRFHTGFSAEYNPELRQFPRGDFAVWEGIKFMNATAALKYLEGYYFYWCSKDYLPRSLNPMEEAYWICQYVLEYLCKMAEIGEGFCPSLSQEKQVLIKKLKKLPVQSNPKQDTLPVITKSPIHKAKKTKTQSKQAVGLSNLADRLLMAKSEAHLQARLHCIDAKLKYGFNEDKDDDDDDDDDDRSTNSAEANEIQAMLNDARPKSRGSEMGRTYGTFSVVWYSEPRALSIVKKPNMLAGVEGNIDNPLENLPTKTETLEYARKIETEKQKNALEHQQFLQYLEDQQEAIQSKNRAAKAATLRNMRDKLKEEIQIKAAMTAQWEEDRRKQHIQEMLKTKQSIKDKQDAEMREIFRIRHIKELQQYKKQRDAEEHAMVLEREKMVISKIANQKESDEIRRMLAEEDRMRYLEERRRVIEQRIEAEQRKKVESQEKKKGNTLEEVDKMQARLRMGNFVWHNGSYGFYDQVRKQPVTYIEYEDEQGVPYFFDPVFKTNIRRRPNDAPIKHYTEDERRAYDEVHGEGSYDAYQAEVKFKESVNKNGGYFDENGVWVSVHGYYDESGNWVEYDGYYNEKGRYVKFAKVQGTLDFMV